MATSTRTYKDATGATKTRLVGENGSSEDVGGVLLFDSSGAVLIGRKAATDSVPVVLSNEDFATVDGIETSLSSALTTLANILTALGAVALDGATLAALETINAIQSGTWTVQPGNTPNTAPWLASIHDGTTKATVRELGTNDALNVAMVDGSGNQVTSFGGGTEYTEGDTDSTITGKALLWEDAADTLTTVKTGKPLPVVQTGTLALPTDAATQTTLAAVLAKLIAAPSTEAKQDTAITSLGTIDGHVDGIEGLITTLNTKIDTLLSQTDGIEASLSSIDTGIPAALGGANATAAMPVTLANDGVFATNFGLQADSEATNDTGSFSFISFVKRFLNTKLKIGQQIKAASLSVSLASDYQVPIVPTNATPAVVASVAANNTDFLTANLDVTNYRSGSFQVSGFGTATIQVQLSNDGGTTWVANRVYTLATHVSATNITASGFYYFTIPVASLMRIRTTAYSSGTLIGVVVVSSLPPPFTTIMDSVGNLQVSINASNQQASVVNTQDTLGVSNNGILAVSRSMLFNNVSYDSWRAFTATTVLASAARTATVSTDVTNYNGRSFAVILNITVAPNTASTLTIQIRVKDSISGNYVTLLASAAILGSAVTGTVPVTNRYVVALGETVAANLAASDALGRTMNVNAVHSNADSWTYSISTDVGL